MKKLALGATLAAASAVSLVAAPAGAVSRTYHIHSSVVFVSSDKAFTSPPVSCNAAFVGSPANGIDSVVVDISKYGAGAASVPVSWTAVDAATPVMGGGLTVQFYNSGCQYMQAAGVQSLGLQHKATSMKVPAGAKWAIFESLYTANVDITFDN